MKKYVIVWMLIAWIYTALLVAATLALHHYDWTYFADISPLYLNHDNLATSVGYDGQFDYFIASDPFSAPEHLDVPVYRFQRIAYPMLVRLLALGKADWVPVTLVLVNLILIGFGTGAFATLLYREQAPAWVPLIFFAWFGVGFSLLFDLNEITAITFALWGVVLFQSKKPLVSGLLFGIAGLGKDMGLIFALPVLASILIERDWLRALKFGALAFGPYTVWAVGLRLVFGEWQTVARTTDVFFQGICANDPSVVFAVVIAFVPAIGLIVLSRKHWREVYYLLTMTSLLFFAFLLFDSYCGHVLFRLGTPLVVASALLLARLKWRLGLTTCGAAWIATAALTWLIPLTE
jgi:hypothetical protein